VHKMSATEKAAAKHKAESYNPMTDW